MINMKRKIPVDQVRVVRVPVDQRKTRNKEKKQLHVDLVPVDLVPVEVRRKKEKRKPLVVQVPVVRVPVVRVPVGQRRIRNNRNKNLPVVQVRVVRVPVEVRRKTRNKESKNLPVVQVRVVRVPVEVRRKKEKRKPLVVLVRVVRVLVEVRRKEVNRRVHFLKRMKLKKNLQKIFFPTQTNNSPMVVDFTIVFVDLRRKIFLINLTLSTQFPIDQNNRIGWRKPWS